MCSRVAANMIVISSCSTVQTWEVKEAHSYFRRWQNLRASWSKRSSSATRTYMVISCYRPASKCGGQATSLTTQQVWRVRRKGLQKRQSRWTVGTRARHHLSRRKIWWYIDLKTYSRCRTMGEWSTARNLESTYQKTSCNHGASPCNSATQPKRVCCACQNRSRMLNCFQRCSWRLLKGTHRLSFSTKLAEW